MCFTNPHVWDAGGNNIIETLAGLEDHAMALAVYEMAVAVRSRDKITLRRGARVVKKNWRE